MKLYNTLTRNVDELVPLKDNTIKLYTCGLTVYNQPHIGNWTGYVYWDVLVRALRGAGYTVIRTQNITDVGHLVSDDDSGEDKMEKGARREGITAWDVADKFINIADHEAYDLLRLIRPEHLVRATDYIPQQIAFAQALEQKDYTYVIPGEGVYFDTSKLSDYGKLARLDITGLEAGNRVSVDGKKNITDFAVWKFSPADAQRDMEWDSPWGKGFPGWHLECSVIARETLGDQIDIHTGGIDHIPVHHTNEIAQTEAVTGKQFATTWVHNNHIKVDGTKMSKSLGNIYTLADIVEHGYSVDAFKLTVLSKHYRTEGNFTWDILEASQNRLNNWREIAALQWQASKLHTTNSPANDTDIKARLNEALSNDLDTPKALQIIDESLDGVLRGTTGPSSLAGIISLVDSELGIDIAIADINQAQQDLIAARKQARNTKDWAASDRLRGQLQEQGINLRDTPAGTLWSRINT